MTSPPPVTTMSLPGNASSPPASGTSAPPILTITGSPAVTTTPAPPPEPKLKVEFKLQKTFTPQLTNKSSPEFNQLKDTVSTALNAVYSQKFGPSFNRTVINGFSQGSVVVDAELIFNNATTLPNASSATQTLKTAASSSNFSLSVNTSSIVAEVVVAATEAPATAAPSTLMITTASTGNASSPPVNGTSAAPGITTIGTPAATTTAATTSDPKIKLGFKLQQTFNPQLTNKSSSEFNQLEDKVTTALNAVYSQKFGHSFNRTVINGFSQGSVVVDAELIFNNATTLPNASSAAQTLKTAASSSNFSLSVNTSTVVAEVVVAPTEAPATTAPSTLMITTPSAAPNTTAAPTAAPNATAAPTAAPNVTAAPTAAPNVTDAPTAAPNTTAASTNSSTAAPAISTTSASTDPPTSSEGTLGLQFSLNQTFTSVLSNSSSAAFQSLATTVVTEVNEAAKTLYGSSFLRSFINAFRSGSVVVDMTLVFKDKNSIPSASSATTQFSTQLSSNSSTLNLIPGSVSAQTTSSSRPRPTMGSLAVFSLTLLAVAQMLIDL
ncbi:mucin-5AC-like isoform X2 [Seriola lalandi dorsalis]|uniref:mucin-5AC-like isoform X2 n=1 Tax=Seriola lalandi dorsalis TaxID=1841481 RepID=UPI000C6F930B|nr:mucin-5AC-like isoform X2 [Seriola lalandi dorsalis]